MSATGLDATLEAIVERAVTRAFEEAIEKTARRTAEIVAAMSADTYLDYKGVAEYLGLGYDAARMFVQRKLKAHVTTASGRPMILKSVLVAHMAASQAGAK